MPILEVRSISMQFPAVRALDDVTLRFESGEVHGIIGENGAGKSTLMKILSGLYSPTEGSVVLDGSIVELDGVRAALAKGIAMIHQELNLVDELTVAENVFLGRELRRGIVLDRTTMEAETAAYLAEVHATIKPDAKVGDLSVAGKQLVEIAKALAVNASILIMDEPTAVLSEPEAEGLFELIRKLREKGVTVLYISHRLKEVCDICDRITVLRDGKFVGTIQGSEASPEVIAGMMVGRELSDFYPPKIPQPTGDPILSVDGLQVPGHVQHASFEVRPGEILGLAGLVGSGRTETAEAVVGARPTTGGEIRVAGVPTRIRNPRDAMKHGIAYVSEDRKALGLILDMSVIHNLTLPSLPDFGKFVTDQGKELECTESWKKRLDIRAGDLEASVLYLSGGNQQKVSLAKWLQTGPKVLILDEPTRGVDVGAKREIYDVIHSLAEQGLACVVISSELPEIIGLCHRAVVMREGRTVGEVSGDQLTEQSLMHLAAGVDAA
ncbi:MAG TPA: sugar ABC transporter ATP-binding protein [Fimbriimonadaceae bacterium]|nr:sugar ABC transporter ATP-binding protein [Fimbriimonadaceae bacterium]